MDTKGGKPQGGGGGGGGVMNWEIGIDMYTLMCIKLMTNKYLLYKKINKIKFKKIIIIPALTLAINMNFLLKLLKLNQSNTSAKE